MLARALALFLFAAPGGLLKDPEASRLFGEAQRAFEEQDYAKAASLIEEAYVIEPNAQLLYPWAQAERSQGNCETAIQLYERFIESGPAAKFAEAAKGNIERCREQIEKSGDATPEPDPEPQSGDELLGPTAPEAEPSDEPMEPPTPAKSSDTKKEPRSWTKDPVGGVLVGVGAAGAVAGGALVGIASSRAKEVGDVELNTEYEDKRAEAKKLHLAGIVTLSVGGALLVSGIVRWVVLAKKSKSSTTARRVDPSAELGTHAWTLGVRYRF